MSYTANWGLITLILDIRFRYIAFFVRMAFSMNAEELFLRLSRVPLYLLFQRYNERSLQWYLWQTYSIVECDNNFNAFIFSFAEYGLLWWYAFILFLPLIFPLLSVRNTPLNKSYAQARTKGVFLTLPLFAPIQCKKASKLDRFSSPFFQHWNYRYSNISGYFFLL